MTNPLQRDEIIGLLERLGGDRDEDVLQAARQAHARITGAGVTWEDLLVPDDAGSADAGSRDARASEARSPETRSRETRPRGVKPRRTRSRDDRPAEDAASTVGQGGKYAESLALIEELLARPDLSKQARRELKDYKEDIADGEFEEGDRRYIRAVHKRLSKRR